MKTKNTISSLLTNSEQNLKKIAVDSMHTYLDPFIMHTFGNIQKMRNLFLKSHHPPGGIFWPGPLHIWSYLNGAGDSIRTVFQQKKVQKSEPLVHLTNPAPLLRKWTAHNFCISLSVLFFTSLSNIWYWPIKSPKFGVIFLYLLWKTFNNCWRHRKVNKQ